MIVTAVVIIIVIIMSSSPPPPSHHHHCHHFLFSSPLTEVSVQASQNQYIIRTVGRSKGKAGVLLGLEQGVAAKSHIVKYPIEIFLEKAELCSCPENACNCRPFMAELGFETSGNS